MSQPPNPYEAPPVQQAIPVAQSAAPQKNQTAGVNGNQLVVTHNAVLPNVCVKTGRPASDTLVKNFTWIPSWLIVTVLASPLIYVLLYYLLRKQMTVRLPVSAEYKAKRQRNLIISNSLLVVFLIVTLAGIYLSVTDKRINDTMSAIYIGMIFFGFLAMLIAAVIASNVGKTLKPEKMDDMWGWFNGAHPDFLNQLK